MYTTILDPVQGQGAQQEDRSDLPPLTSNPGSAWGHTVKCWNLKDILVRLHMVLVLSWLCPMQCTKKGACDESLFYIV